MPRQRLESDTSVMKLFSFQEKTNSEKEIQESKESVIKIAKKYNINPKTVQKWRHRDSVSDRSSRNIKLRSSLSEMDQQIIVI